MFNVRNLIAFAFVLASTTTSSAALVSFSSDVGLEGLGSYDGSMDYTFSDANNAQLIVTLTNTSPPANGGFITAFAFDQPGGITGVTLATATNLDNLLGSPTFSGSIAAPPFDDLDIGASLSGDWVGGGSPNPGVGVGATGSWTFTLTGNDLDLLTSQDFVDELLIARFRGFENGGSDKVPNPEMSSILLAGLGAASVLLIARRRRAKIAA